MEFKQFKKALQDHVAVMLSGGDQLFLVNIPDFPPVPGNTAPGANSRLWNTYLNTFPAGTNEIFRERREYDCSACRSFIKEHNGTGLSSGGIGNVVTIKEGKITSIWDFWDSLPEDSEYKPSVKAMSAIVRHAAMAEDGISDVFVYQSPSFGIDKNREEATDGSILTWEHLHVKLPPAYASKCSSSVAPATAAFRDARNVFKRSLDEITIDSTETVLELIASNSLYKGEENTGLLQAFLALQKEYNNLHADGPARSLYAWEKSVLIGPALAKIRNHAIGTLLTDISCGVDLDEAVRKFEAMVAPANYKRPKAIYTQAMLKAAEETVSSLGYFPSLKRRHAKLDDISVGNVLFADRDAAPLIAGDVFSSMKEEAAAVNPKNFSKVEEVGIDTFVSDILPSSASCSLLLEARHGGNLVSLIAPEDKDAPSMFKWPNGFSWAYAGNMADSMKQRVKEAGGKVDGDLRFSIQWNDDLAAPSADQNDLDAHCIEPGGNEIYYGTAKGRAIHKSGGELDVDIRFPQMAVAVENITWPDRNRMSEGKYLLFVRNFDHRGGRTGFKAEVEFDGQIHSFVYGKEVKQAQNVQVAEVMYSRLGGFDIVEKIPSELGAGSSRKVWGVNTNTFVPVVAAMHSPNFWLDFSSDEAERALRTGVGNKHFFFMLKGCVNPEQPNGFFNEYLKEELMQHKRVFEALGARMKVAESPDQLSGVGFSSTQRNHFFAKVEGRVARVLKVMV